MSALSYSSQLQAHSVGKPSYTFFSSVCQRLGVSLPQQPNTNKEQSDNSNSNNNPSSLICMVGDDVLDDCLGAQEHGIDGILVKTGKYRDGDEIKHKDNKGQPTRVYDNVEVFIKELLRVHQRQNKSSKL